MKPSCRMTLVSLPLPFTRTPALGGVLFALCLGAGCGSPPGMNEEGSIPESPESGLGLIAQTARVPQATLVAPATAFAGAAPILTITGRNFTPDLRVSIAGTSVPIIKLVSTTQVQVQLPATINTVGKKLVRVEDGLTYRGTERDDLFTLSADPLNLQPLDQLLDAPTGKLVAAGDANGDGKPDAFVLSADGLNLRVYLSSGRAVLQMLPGISTYNPISTFTLGDLNGDGKLDIVTVNSSWFNVYLGDGAGKFSSAGGLYDSRSSGVDSLQGNIALGDVNGDGKPDLCLGTRSGELAYAAGKGDGTFVSITTLWRSSAGWPIMQLQLTDVNGD